MIAEPWNTLLFVAVIPIVHQFIKWISDQYGYTFNKLINQGISLVLAFVFMYFSGGFAGLEFPAWEGDLVQFASDLLVLIGAGWGALTVLYEAIWDKLFIKFKFATADKL